MGLLRRRRNPADDSPGPPEVRPGRIVESPSPAGGAQRRCFGEFVGGRGELASYAFGWTAEDDAGDQEGHMTVGIGAGNEGGGSFHWAVVRSQGNYGFVLADDPFESVPQGGPDLTADQARAHLDLQFVFWVGDVVMEKDPRAVWMLHWLIGSMAIETRQVADREEPVLLIGRDDHEEVPWQLIGTSDAASDGRLEHLHHHLEQDPTLLEAVAGLTPGREAVRDAPGTPWYFQDAAPETD